MQITVQISGWEDGLRKITMTDLLQKYGGFRRKEAKGLTDRVVEGGTVEVPIATRGEAEKLVRKLAEIHAIAEVVTAA